MYVCMKFVHLFIAHHVHALLNRSAMMRTVVLLAARPLSNGDELCMDYRLNPKAGKLPDWYVAYGSEEKEKAEAEARSGENE